MPKAVVLVLVLVMATNRRHFLRDALAFPLGAMVPPGLLGGCAGPRFSGRSFPGSGFEVSEEDDRFLEELSRRAFAFFAESAHPITGQVLDRRRADGETDSRGVASIASTGFGLTAFCVGVKRGWMSAVEARERVLRTLSSLHDDLEQVHGFFYHFLDASTGRRIWKCELSSIDTAILLCGVLACRAAFLGDERIHRLATSLYERVDWPWMLAGGDTFSMGWFPERGFLEARWDHFSELMMLYLLALGSPTHPVGPETWGAWRRPLREYYGERFVWSPAPLFVHQFSHAWFDFRGCVDRGGVDWFANSVAATRAHLEWSLDQKARFPEWSEDLWGVTSSDSARGYVGWGGPPDSGPLDGTVVPCAPAGSLPFLPRECLRTLRHQRERFGSRIWKRYGFVDAWNPHTGWINPDVVGIDVGITLLMAENLRSGGVWEWMRSDPDLRRGMDRAGFTGLATTQRSRGRVG